MARKDFVAKQPLRYGTRMLQAGDPLSLDGPNGRLYQALGLVEEPADDAEAASPPPPPPPPTPPAAPRASGTAGKKPASKKRTARKAKARAKT